jgi:hypothetical protein
MSTQEQIELAAQAAGEWWADKLLGSFAEKREEFAAVVSDLVAQELRGECYYDWWGERQDGPGREGRSRSEFDYDPHNLLCAAFAQVWPDSRSWDFKRAMPQKHSLDVTPTELEPKEGYGNWLDPIPVTEAPCSP